MKINQISPQEHEFTEVLTSIALMPKTLYFIGNLPKNVVLERPATAKKAADDGQNFAKTASMRPKCVGIVGARKNTPYGREVAYQAAYQLAKQGAIVISGLAIGIDSIAHLGALDAGGITIAVLGTPINKIYPRRHLALAQEIIEKGGAIISELPPDAEFFPKTSFLARNRLISGLSDAVLIAEAAERSGSLNTAAHAIEQGRELFAAPGDITRVTSQGCNKLIASGAQPYTGPADIAEVLFPAPPKKRQNSAQLPLFVTTPAERKIAEQLLAGLRDGEEIIAATGLTAPEFSQAITMMEINGVVKPLGMNNWMLK